MPTFERKQEIADEFRRIAHVGRNTPLSRGEKVLLNALKKELIVEKIINGETKNVIDLSSESLGTRTNLEAIDFGIIFKLTELRGAKFQWADLAGADFRGARLQGAYLRGANLRWAMGKPIISNTTICLDLKNVPDTDDFADLRARQEKCKKMFKDIFNISKLNRTALYLVAKGFDGSIHAGERDIVIADGKLFVLQAENPELFNGLLNIRRKQIEANPTLKSICDAYEKPDQSSFSYEERLRRERRARGHSRCSIQ